jgi:hypothetical protein
MATQQHPDLQQTVGIPFDTSDFTMHSYPNTVTFGTMQNTTMEEWDDNQEFAEDDENEFEQFLFGEDED